MAAELGETVEVLTIQVWHSQGEVSERCSVMVQTGPKYAITLDADAPSDGPLSSAQYAESALWAWTHGGQVGLVAMMAAQPGRWFEPYTSHKAF